MNNIEENKLNVKQICKIMKKILYLVMLPLFVGCGNAVQKTAYAEPVDSDSISVVDSVEEWTEPESEEIDNYSTEDPGVVKTFEVIADAYRYNSATGNFSSRGDYTLQVTLYSDHSLYAVGREGVPMRVQKSLEDKWDYMCAVPGENNYVYFFNTDEIYSN